VSFSGIQGSIRSGFQLKKGGEREEEEENNNTKRKQSKSKAQSRRDTMCKETHQQLVLLYTNSL
jgi:hypothetical protein